MTMKSLWRRLRGTPAAHEAELDEELDFHREMRERELRESGLSAEEARLRCKQSLGNLTLVRENAREAWSFEWLRDILRDFRFGGRTLAAQPAFTVTAVLALVLGIGVNATVFSIYNTLAFAPWVIKDVDRTVQVLTSRGGGRSAWGGVSWPLYRYLRAHSKTAEGIAAYTNTSVRITSGELSWNGMGIATSDNFFDLLGTGFALGRGFSPETNFRNPVPEVVLQHETWTGRFGGDPGLVGKWIDVNGHQLQVVGIAAPGFVGPSPNVPELWITGAWRDIMQPGIDTIDNAENCCVSMLARLTPGLDQRVAQAELYTLSRQFLDSRSQQSQEVRMILTRPAMMANPSLSAKVAPVFIAIGVACLLVLLLACANVANLQIARALARQREIAVRLSLGASRFRIFRQLLAESLLLSATASVASLAIAAWLPGWVIGVMVNPMERLTFKFTNDIRVCGFVLVLTVLIAVVLGMLPAFGAVRDAVSSGLREGGRATGGGRLRSILLGAQVALCAILLTGASLLIRALDKAQHIDPGFRYSDVLLMSPNLNSSGATDQQATGILAALTDQISGMPGVLSVAHATVVPLGNSFDGGSTMDPKTNQRVNFGYNQVSANFLETIGVPLVMGRMFAPADEIRVDTMIVTESLAQRVWPDESPLGKSFAILGRNPVVVGVVRNFNSRELGFTPEPQVFIPGRGTRTSFLMIRHSQSVSRDVLLASLPKVARNLDRRMLASVAPFERNVVSARRTARVSATIAGCLSSLALILACVGIYGVASYNVSQRTREIGVRMALGAQSRSILSMVVAQSLPAVLAGTLAGIAGALVLASLLTTLLYGVQPADPVAMSSALGILLAMAVLSALQPARKATAVDPAITLRHD